MRRICLLALACVFLTGCGSSGGGGSNATPTSTGPRPTKTPGGPTRTPRPTETPGGPTRTITQTRTPAPPQTLFVRASGNDDNPGTSPDQAIKTMTKAAELLRPGTTLYVGKGTYRGRIEISGVAGTATAPVDIVADTTGQHTGDGNGAVTLDGNGETVVMLLTKSPYVTIDGFVFTGAQPQTSPKLSATAIHARSASDHFTIQNCIVGNASTADGIRVESSSDALIFNNLILENDRGIVVSGDAPNARVINNTIATQERVGILFEQKGGNAPINGTVTNNIVQENGNDLGINVDDGPPSSGVGYVGNFNLVFEPAADDQTMDYRPTSIRGTNDINEDAQFVNLGQGDVRLEPSSPAVNGGSGTIDSSLANELFKRTTTVDGLADRAPIDLGYHYPR